MPRLWARAAPIASSTVAAVLPVVQAAVVERVEHELAGEPEQVEGAAAVLGEERPGRREVLAVHDLRRLGRRRYSSLRCRSASRANDVVEVGAAARRDHPSGAARCRRVRAAVGDAVADRRVGVVPQPRRRLHDVGVGVVHDQPRRVVPHARSLPPPTYHPRSGRDLSRNPRRSAQMERTTAAAIVRSPVTAPAVTGRRGRVAEARACKALYPGSIPGVASTDSAP